MLLTPHHQNKLKNCNIKLAARGSLAKVAGSKYMQRVATHQNSTQEDV